MNKKDEFKEFVRSRPELVDFIKSGEMSWQKFYELFDLYGSDRGVWDKYSGNTSNGAGANFSKIGDMMKGVNMDSIQEHIGTAQKALGFVQELTASGKTPVSNVKGPSSPRPINKFFGD